MLASFVSSSRIDNARPAASSTAQFQVREPVIIHWLGDMFDPALAGYWGTANLDKAMDTAVAIINANAAKVDGATNRQAWKKMIGLPRKMPPMTMMPQTNLDERYLLLRRLVDADKPAEHAEAKAPASPPPAPVASPDDVSVSVEAPRRATRSERDTSVTDARSSGEVHFLEMEPGQLIGDPVAIDSSSMKIGRSAPAEIVLPHKSVSREHCVVGLANDELFVTDLNSTNGTYIDGVRISRVSILPVGS